MNSKRKDMKFTFKTEDLNNFLFLDVKITRKNKRFVTPIFRKARFSGVLTNYQFYFWYLQDRFSPQHASVTVFQNLFQYRKFSYRTEHLRSIFKCNHYPVNPF